MHAKTLIWIGHGLSSIILLAAFWMLISGADKKRTAEEIANGRVVFTPNTRAVWVWLPLVGYAACWSVYDALHSRIFLSVFWGWFALAFLFALPETVVTSEEGIQQTRWYWHNKFVLWREIVEIRENGGAMTVISSDGTKVRHSYQLADRKRFMEEIRRHCNDDLPPEFPAE